MVASERRRVIAPEIAERYGRTMHTISKTWTQHPEWPEPVGKRGRWKEYDADEVDKVVKRLFMWSPPEDAGDPDDLLTINEIADYTGLARSTVDADISRGRLPQPDEDKDGVKRWKRSTINEAMSKRSKRTKRVE